MADIRETRDLLGGCEPDEYGDPEYPSHIRIMDFQFEDTNLAASLWLGNENSGTECDAMLTDEDLEWMIGVLQRCLDKARS